MKNNYKNMMIIALVIINIVLIMNKIGIVKQNNKIINKMEKCTKP